MLKMGAKFEGVHRRHMRRADGTLRDTAWFSVIREEWPQVRADLEARLA
jgi:RimJ/RimL family protein N-acetyltransferase